MSLIPITDMCKHKALFFDSLGVCVGEKRIKFQEETFEFKDGNYNFIPEKSSFFKRTYWFSSTKYYFYNLGNPMPICLRRGDSNTSIIDACSYRRIMETRLIKELNDLGDSNFLNFLKNPKFLIIGVVVIALIWWLASGHSFTDLGSFLTSSTPSTPSPIISNSSVSHVSNSSVSSLHYVFVNGTKRLVI